MKKAILSLTLSALAVLVIYFGNQVLGTVGFYLLNFVHDTWVYERYFSHFLPLLIPILCSALPAWIVGFLIMKLNVTVNWKMVVSFPLILAIILVYLHVTAYLIDLRPLSFIWTLGMVLGSLISPLIIAVFLNPKISERD